MKKVQRQFRIALSVVYLLAGVALTTAAATGFPNSADGLENGRPIGVEFKPVKG